MSQPSSSGRKRFKPTDAQRRQVSDWLKQGESQSSVAKRLGIALRTFQTHFRAEIQRHGRRQGQPAYRPSAKDRRTVKALATAGVEREAIAACIEVSVSTLKRHFKPELATAKVMNTAAVTESLVRMATDKKRPNVVAAMFYLKCQAGWMEEEKRLGQGQGKKSREQAAALETQAQSDFQPRPVPKHLLKAVT